MARPLAWHFNQAATINFPVVSPDFRVLDALDQNDNDQTNRRPVGVDRLYIRGRIVATNAPLTVAGDLLFTFYVTSGTVGPIAVTAGIGAVANYLFSLPINGANHFVLQYTPTGRSYLAGELLITMQLEEVA